MNLEELKKWKNFLGYSNKMLAEKAGLPLGTVQKILSGETKAPRYKTIMALEKAIDEGAEERIAMDEKLAILNTFEMGYVHDSHPAYAYDDYEEHPEAAEQKSNTDRNDIVKDAWTRSWRRQGTYTAEDYDAIPGEIRVELINGVIYDQSAPTSTHQIITQNIFSVLNNHRLKHGGGHRRCMPFIAPVDVQLNEEDPTIVQPDILVYCNEERKDILRRIIGVPEFIVEVISPSSKRRDMVLKTNKYMEAGVKEYWIVDPDSEVIWVYDFRNDISLVKYTFDEQVPVLISCGKLSVNFAEIKALIAEL